MLEDRTREEVSAGPDEVAAATTSTFLEADAKEVERHRYKKTLNGLLASQLEFEVHTAYRFKVSLLPASSSITSNLTFARLLLLKTSSSTCLVRFFLL